MFSDLADMTVAVCSDILGATCVYTYQGGGSEIFNAIYVKERDVYETEQGVITGVSEVISAPASSFSQTPKQGDSLTINSINYEVIEPDNDGTAVMLYLRLK